MAREKTGQRHKNKVYFKVQDLYPQAFPLNHLSYCGGAAGEVFYAASRINEKDLESWVAQWSTLATRLEAQAPVQRRYEAREPLQQDPAPRLREVL